MVTLLDTTVDLNADCAEFCPVPGCQRRLAVGTYQLEEDIQRRIGRLHLYTLQGLDEVSLIDHCSLDTSGIFDMRWLSRSQEDPVIVLAGSDGHVSLVADSITSLKVVDSVRCFPDSMAASVALQEGADCGTRVASSSSGGELAVMQIAESCMRTEACWGAHDLEAWTCCFDRWNGSTLYSGGDDCAFKAWDLRQDPPQAVFSNRREHGAGVCCIASSHLTEHELVTGSYDEKVRQWDTRQMKTPVCQVSTGGGVWRLKYHPTDPRLLLAACMHNGFAGSDTLGSLLRELMTVQPQKCRMLAVLRSSGSSRLEVAHDYAHQKTLGYGADWCHNADLPVVATASFYDRALHIWRPPALDVGG